MSAVTGKSKLKAQRHLGAPLGPRYLLQGDARTEISLDAVGEYVFNKTQDAVGHVGNPLRHGRAVDGWLRRHDVAMIVGYHRCVDGTLLK